MEGLSDVRVFVEVVECGSFTMAAERLELSRPVVSKYLGRLEERLGARLLNRTTRKLSLTEIGRAYYERCRRGLHELQEAEDEVLLMQGTPRGLLRVNAPMTFGILHIAPALQAFQQRYLEVQVQLNLDDRKVDVIEAGFDVSLRIAELPDSSLVARRLFICRHAIVAAPAYLDAHGTPRTPGELINHHVVTYDYQQSSDTWHFIDPAGSDLQVALPARTRINNSLAIREAVKGGLGIARMPTFSVGAELASGELVAILTDHRMLEPSAYLLFPQRRHLSPKVQAFSDFMAMRFADPPTWDQQHHATH